MAELDGAGAVVRRFVYGSRFNVPDYVLQAGATYRVISDHLGSPRRVVNVNDDTDVLLDVSYDEFGNASGLGLSDATFGFAGGLYDHDTGLVRFGARDYDAVTGRWTSRDPIRWQSGQGNLYHYVGGDPQNRSDASGLQGVAIGGSFFGGFCAGYCAPGGGGGGGLYIGTEGVGFYASGDISAGGGIYAGAGGELSYYSSLDAFQGVGVGARLDGAILEGLGISVVGNENGFVGTLSYGIGVGVWGGLLATFTAATDPLAWADIADALTPGTETDDDCP